MDLGILRGTAIILGREIITLYVKEVTGKASMVVEVEEVDEVDEAEEEVDEAEEVEEEAEEEEEVVVEEEEIKIERVLKRIINLEK